MTALLRCLMGAVLKEERRSAPGVTKRAQEEKKQKRKALTRS
jgi:hypothetical protein